VIGLVQVATSASDVPTIARSLTSLRETFLSAEGLSLDELDTIANRIRDAAVNSVDEGLAALDLPSGIGHSSDERDSGLQPSRGYRKVSPWWRLGMHGRGVLVEQYVGVLVKLAGTDDTEFVIMTSDGRLLPIELREVYPVFSTVFTIKLRTWADAVVRDLLARFDQESRKTLRAPE
jgi:hypothetical protein